MTKTNVSLNWLTHFFKYGQNREKEKKGNKLYDVILFLKWHAFYIFVLFLPNSYYCTIYSSSQNSRLRSFHFNEFSIACDNSLNRYACHILQRNAWRFIFLSKNFFHFFLSIKCLTSIQNRINCFGKKLRPKSLNYYRKMFFFFDFNLNKISNFMNHGHFFSSKTFSTSSVILAPERTMQF